ncbi:MAG: hypothetical protein QGI49_03665 [SAR202 cluster bacterium]|nr:hypothetical protein [SAR202 cluster bacterium]
MEGIFFILIGAALFTQSWYTLGLYSEGRTMGVLVGGLGLLALGTFALGGTMDATLLVVNDGDGGKADAAKALTEMTVLKALMMVWVVYTFGVAAHGLWEFEDRAIGFYSGFVAVVSLIVFLFFAIELRTVYTDAVWLLMAAAPAMLTLLAAISFFYLAFQWMVLRLVTGWFMLLGSGAVIGIGLVMLGSDIA